MNFGEALEHMKAGRCVARQSWAARGVSLLIVPGLTITVADPPLANVFPVGDTLRSTPYLALEVGGILTTWSPGGDVLADDWVVTKAELVAPGRPAPKVRRTVKKKRKA